MPNNIHDQARQRLADETEDLACMFTGAFQPDPRATVPDTPKAREQGAAGHQVVAYARGENREYAAVVYRDPSEPTGLGFAHGDPSEVLPSERWR